jgi:2'-hydroxyisoflavone reductase
VIPSRREFLAAASAGTAAAVLAPSTFALAAVRAREPMSLLVMGGTGFLGPHLIHVALERGHQVTMFNRGKTEPKIFVDQFERVEALRGDRRDAEALAALGTERKWDAVIDTSAYYPRVVDMAVGLLKDRVRHYSLISTVSVYGERNDIGMDETAPVATIEDETTEEITGLTYGPLKALCEQAAERLMPGRVANIRPGLIVGKGDSTDRYTYWVDRIHRAGRVLAPGTGDDYTQYIDSLTMRGMLGAIRSASGSDAELVWADTPWLLEQGVQPWQEMPAWVPPTFPGYEGFGQLSAERAAKAGLTVRTAEDTAKATLDWWLTLPEDRRRALRAGLDAEAERKVLAAWDARDG